MGRQAGPTSCDVGRAGSGAGLQARGHAAVWPENSAEDSEEGRLSRDRSKGRGLGLFWGHLLRVLGQPSK